MQVHPDEQAVSAIVVRPIQKGSAAGFCVNPIVRKTIRLITRVIIQLHITDEKLLSYDKMN